MRLPQKRRKELDEIVQNFCRGTGFNTKEDLFKELNKIGFDVYSAQFKRQLAGMILVNENVEKLDKFDSNKVIIYNKKYNYYEIRFILLHELAHYISRKFVENDAKLLFAVRDHNEEYHDDVEEQEMDYMAAAMLVPTDEIINDIKEYKHDLKLDTQHNYADILKQDEYFIQRLQRKYKIEKILAMRRIEEVLEGTEVG